MERSVVCTRLRIASAKSVTPAVYRLHRIRDFDERNSVGDDDGIVPRDHVLLRNIENDVLGDHLVGDLVKIGNDDAQPGRERPFKLTKALDNPFFALGHDSHALPGRDQDEDQ
jgi:hypothetical protein